MRHADDLSDEPDLPLEQRRQKLDDWIDGLRRVVGGGKTDDPVLMALADSQKRFNIPIELLDQLVQGTTWMLPPKAAATYAVRDLRPALRLLLPRRVGRRPDLHSHLRLSRSARRALAERTGVAFQLTNILRDVKEDAELGRVYLPRKTSGGSASTRMSCSERRRAVCDAAVLPGSRSAPANTIARPTNFFRSSMKTASPRCGRWWRFTAGCWSELRNATTTFSPSGYVSSTAEKLGVLAKGFVRALT